MHRLINFYVELEAKKEEDIKSLLELIDYEKENLTTLDVTSIYNDIYGIDIMSIKELKFDNEIVNKKLTK